MTNKVLYEKDGRIGRITLNRPDVLNAIDDELPGALAEAVARAEADPGIHVMVLSGNGAGFCSGYDLDHYTGSSDQNKAVQDMPWDPIQDYTFMWRNTEYFMSLWRAMKPVICKVHGFALAGGSDIALCADITIMSKTAKIGYMPARVWGCPTTAMWIYRVGAEKAKRMLFTGDKISGEEAQEIGLIFKAVAEDQLDTEVETLATRIATVPINQLAMQKMLVNQAIDDYRATCPYELAPGGPLFVGVRGGRLGARTVQAGMELYERVFGTPYPYEKYDQIFVPEYNPGYATCNDLCDSLLFGNRDDNSLAGTSVVETDVGQVELPQRGVRREHRAEGRRAGVAHAGVVVQIERHQRGVGLELFRQRQRALRPDALVVQDQLCELGVVGAQLRQGRRPLAL